MSHRSSQFDGNPLLFDSESAALDSLLDALSHRRRRFVVRYLDGTAEPIALADLADEIAAREGDVPIDETDPAEVERVVTSLHHVHLPRLADHGLVEYDLDRKSVAPTDDGRFDRSLALAMIDDR